MARTSNAAPEELRRLMMPRRLCLLLLACGAFASAATPLLAQASAPLPLPEMHWRMIGPFRGGRTRAAAGVRSQPNVFYVGQVNGGVWKSTDYGRTWNPIFDAEPTQSIGAIAVAPSDPNVVYVASGEGLHRPDLSVGNGIYRSVDAGKSWQRMGTALSDGQQIPALAVDPRDANRLYAAVLGHPYGANEERGIYRSTDGGASWKRVLFKDANTGGSDVELDPTHPDTVYATMWESRLGPWEDGNSYEGAGGGLWKSTDGGESWRKLTTGLPENLAQIEVAVAASDSRRLYATLATTRQGGYGTAEGLGVYRSDDAGESWAKATDDPRPAMKIGGGDLPIVKVDPKNADVVYSASIVTTRSVDGGRTWTSLRGAPGGDDYQNLWINPENPAIILLVSDQGAIVSVNRGESWSSWYNQPTAQLYHVAVTSGFPYKVCAGQQESGSVCIASRGNDGTITFRDWHPAGVIEYGYVAPDPLHPDIVFGAGLTEVSKYDMVTGEVQNVTPLPVKDGYRADRTEPILFSTVDPHLLLYAANVLFESRDEGQTWRQISPDLSREHAGQPASLAPLPDKDKGARRGAIYAVAASPLVGERLWAGTDDGLLWTTHDHGAHWKDVTPPAMTPWSKVTQIEASHFDQQTAYASVSRMRIDDLRPYLYRTRDGGGTWQPIAKGLPANAPVNTVREDPERKGLLFAGTETAVWLSLDEGDHWQPLQLNLPHTSMRDLWIKDNDLIVATHGRSFWILDDISPLREMDAASTAAAEPFLFKPGRAYRVRRSTNTDTPLPIDEPQGENPPDGAVIDYRLPEGFAGAVALEILDAKGGLVRRYASTDAPEATPEELGKQLIPLYWLRMPRTLPTSAGMHRWVWDLRYTTPVATHYEYPIAAVPHATPRTPQGPLALPGTYTVRLTAGGKTLSASVIVRMDPRVQATEGELGKLFALESRLAGMVDRSAAAALEAHAAEEQLARVTTGARGALRGEAERLQKELGAVLAGGEEREREKAGGEEAGLDDLSGEAAALYAQVGAVDAVPTVAQERAAAAAERELGEALERWERSKRTTLPAVNRLLREAHEPELDLRRRPQTMPEGGDED